MKPMYLPFVFILMASALMMGTTGCRLVEGIFKAGVGVGVVIVVAALLAIGGVVALVRR